MLVAKEPAQSGAISSLGEELVITGQISCKGDLHLSGQLRGDVHCHKLLVGKAAKIQGNVIADEVVVQGSIWALSEHKTWCCRQSVFSRGSMPADHRRARSDVRGGVKDRQESSLGVTSGSP